MSILLIYLAMFHKNPKILKDLDSPIQILGKYFILDFNCTPDCSYKISNKFSVTVTL